MAGITNNALSAENLRMFNWRQQALHDIIVKPELHWPYLRPCTVRLLIVADGLDFSAQDFGLSTFVQTLLDMPGRHVRFNITLGHIDNVSATQMMGGEPRIARRLTRIRFDDAAHFAPDMYDVVLLFGIAVSFAGRGNNAAGQPYPAERLADMELRRLTEFMNAGGGLFATGDHGALGRALCHAIPRARGMRLWDSTAPQNDIDQVSMSGQRRNDTNRIGPSAGSQFDDQSDDVPQSIAPKIYSRSSGIFRALYPHPLLCGPNGIIRVMPDHPHEGECVEPTDTAQSLNFGGAELGVEYPPGVGGSPRPLPEVISWNSVLAGTESGGKAPTVAQTFGGICAYDGHRAGIGRVATDATWHHFVNVNLVGVAGLPDTNPKGLGFLASAAGQAHFEEIKAYYRNIAVWLSPPERIACMNARLSWGLVWSERVMEAVLSTTRIKLAGTQPHVLRLIGSHARDVLGRTAGQCQSLRIILDLVLVRALPDLIPHIDPWWPEPKRVQGQDDTPWLDLNPLLDISFGGALVALREAFPEPNEKLGEQLDPKRIEAVMAEGGKIGLERGLKSVAGAMDVTRGLLRVR